MIFESYFIVIYATCFVTAIISASLGFLGGTILLAVLAQYLKMEQVIPIHGLIQIISNGSRAWTLQRFIVWGISKEAILGTIVGAICGYFYLIQIPENIFNLCLGLFILWMTLGPKLKARFHFRYRWVVFGFMASSLGLFMGAVGTFVGSLLYSEKLEKKPMVATQAMLQTIIHLSKIVVFTALGFSMVPWMGLIGGCVVATYFGTYVGTRLLDYIPEKVFRLLVIIILALLALRLIYSGISGM